MRDLDAALLRAHAEDDRAALITLYGQAAQCAVGTAKAFYLTHAWVFALEAGDPRAPELETVLARMGCA
ncbi:MAG: hypothetical protein AAFY65_17305 [Pseudomonadota bacterium]